MQLFSTLSPLELKAIVMLCQHPFGGHEAICKRLYCSPAVLTVALMKALVDEPVKSRLRLFDRLGYIKIHTRKQINGKMTALVFDYLRQHPSATVAEIASATGYSPHTVRNQSRHIYTAFEYKPVLKTQTRLTRLHFYASMGWFQLERLRKDAKAFNLSKEV